MRGSRSTAVPGRGSSHKDSSVFTVQPPLSLSRKLRLRMGSHWPRSPGTEPRFTPVSRALTEASGCHCLKSHYGSFSSQNSGKSLSLSGPHFLHL